MNPRSREFTCSDFSVELAFFLSEEGGASVPLIHILPDGLNRRKSGREEWTIQANLTLMQSGVPPPLLLPCGFTERHDCEMHLQHTVGNTV